MQFEQLLTFVAVTVVVFPAIAILLVFWPASRTKTDDGPAIAEFQSFVASGTVTAPAEARFFIARDGAKRLYRMYGNSGEGIVVLLHGSGSDSRYLAGFATTLAGHCNARVATLDMRGHGPNPNRRGDLDYVAQQEHDIADLVKGLKEKYGMSQLLVGGHSIGGGLAIRYAAGGEAPRPDGLLLIAPYVHRKAPSARPGSGGWATPRVTRFAGIEMLHRLGIHILDWLPVIRFAVATASPDGTETPLYSWRMFASVTPRRNWRNEISSIDCPTLVLGAEHDTIFRSTGYHEIFSSLPKVNIDIIPDIGHFELTTSTVVRDKAASWLQSRIFRT